VPLDADGINVPSLFCKNTYERSFTISNDYDVAESKIIVSQHLIQLLAHMKMLVITCKVQEVSAYI
jgi:hypothetical protein